MSNNIAADSASSATKSFFGGITGTIGVVVGCVIVSAILCVGLIVFAGILDSGSEDSNTEPTKVSDSSTISGTTNTAGQDSTPQKFKINDTVELGDMQLVVYALEENLTTDNMFVEPQDGMKFVAVDVKVTNVGDTSRSVSEYGFSLGDKENYSYDYYYYAVKEPEFDSKTLDKGMSVRGWITFEVRNDSSNFTLFYEPDFWSNQTIQVELF